MKTSRHGICLVKEFEGFRDKPYRDSAGVVTIGYGHTRTANTYRSDQHITYRQAEKLLKEDLLDAEVAVKRYVKVPLNQNQFDALVSWTFNLGAGSLKRSTMLKFLNWGLYWIVPSQMKRWNKAGGVKLKGLVRRRRREANLFKAGTKNIMGV